MTYHTDKSFFLIIIYNFKFSEIKSFRVGAQSLIFV